MSAAHRFRSFCISPSESNMSLSPPGAVNSARNPAIVSSALNILGRTGGFGPVRTGIRLGRSFRKWNQPPDGQGFALSTLMQWHTTPSEDTPHQSACSHIGHGSRLDTLRHPFISRLPSSPC